MYALCSYGFIVIECILIVTQSLLLQVVGMVNSRGRITVGRTGGLLCGYVWTEGLRDLPAPEYLQLGLR